MPRGPGKYDGVATLARELTGAQAVVLVVFDGADGSGFSIQLTKPFRRGALGEVLRRMADSIDCDEADA